MEKMIIKKWDWKTWAIVGLGGVAIITTGAFVMQAKHAALGRQVHRNVTKFLIDNGARIDSGVISGGMVSIPMKTGVAVNSTVVSLLNMFSDQSGGRPPLNPAVSSDEPVLTGRHSPTSGVAPGGPASSGMPVPSPRGNARGSRATTSAIHNPTDSPDDGGFRAREGQKGGDFSYNPMEFAPQGSRPPENVDIFDDHSVAAAASSSTAAPPAQIPTEYE